MASFLQQDVIECRFCNGFQNTSPTVSFFSFLFLRKVLYILPYSLSKFVTLQFLPLNLPLKRHWTRLKRTWQDSWWWSRKEILHTVLKIEKDKCAMSKDNVIEADYVITDLDRIFIKRSDNYRIDRNRMM